MQAFFPDTFGTMESVLTREVASFQDNGALHGVLNILRGFCISGSSSHLGNPLYSYTCWYLLFTNHGINKHAGLGYVSLSLKSGSTWAGTSQCTVIKTMEIGSVLLRAIF